MTVGRVTEKLIKTMQRLRLGASVAMLCVALTAAVVEHRVAVAQTENIVFSIPAGPLTDALLQFGIQSGLQVSADNAAVRDKVSGGVSGAMSPETALEQVLAGTGIGFQKTGANTVTLRVADGAGVGPFHLNPITVEAVLGGTLSDSYNNPYSFSATRTDTPLIETPQSAQSLPRQAIEDSGARKVGDTFDYLAGVVKENNVGGQVGDRYTARGFTADNILINGNRTGTPQSLDLGNVEQVEVLRGPTATLFGRGESGGLINVVTKQPLSEQYAAATLEGASGVYGEGDRLKNGRVALDAGGPMDEAGRIRYRFNLAAQNKISFRDEIDEQVFLIAPVVEAEIDKDTVVNFEASYQYGNEQFDRGVPFIYGEPLLDRNFNPGGNDIPDVDKHYVSSIFRADHTLSNTWRARVGFYSSATFLQGGGIEVTNTNGQTTALRRRNETLEEYFFTFQPELIGEFETGSVGHTLLMGADFGFDRSHANSKIGANSATYDLLNPAFPTVPEVIGTGNQYFQADRKETGTGFYVQDQVDLTDAWKVLLGLRYDRIQLSNDTDYAQPGFTTNVDEFYSDDVFLPRMGLVYQPIDEVSFYTSYAEGYRPPTTSFGLLDVNGDPVQPETSKSMEVGVKLDALGGDISGTFAAFRIDKKNVLEAGTGLNFLRARNLGKVRSEGFEFDLAGQVDENLKLGVTYSYTNASVRGGGTDPKGTRIRNVPLHMASLQGTYEFRGGSMDGLRLFAGLVYESKQKTDTSQTIRTQIPDYIRADIGGEYTFNDAFTAALSVRNVTDEEYYVTAAGQNNVYPGEPLSVSLRLIAEF